jgi:hypothetical protein
MGFPSPGFSLALDLPSVTCSNDLWDIPLDLGKCLIEIRHHVFHIFNTD